MQTTEPSMESPFNFKLLSSSDGTPGTTPKFSSESPGFGLPFSPGVLAASVDAVRAAGSSGLRNVVDMSAGGPPTNGDVPVFGRKRSEAQRRDIDDVVEILRRRPGVVSETGIERLAKHNGLEVFKEDIDGGKRISLGGRISLIDIDLLLPESKVTKVAFSLASMINASTATSAADEILLKDLSSPSLDRFARNLERVARHDKLSTAEIDNFQVLDGLYRNALQKIYSRELADEKDAENEGHGKPGLDEEGVLGLSMWYWNDRHGSDALPAARNRYRVIVEIDESGRTETGRGVAQNNDWIGEEPFVDGHVNWNEPDYSNLQDQCTAFVLTLDPPVTIPYYDAAILDPEGEAEVETLPTFDGSRDTLTVASGKVRDSTDALVEYQFSLTSTRIAEMRKIEKVYVAHPRHIFSVFEILRQAIRTQSLIHSVFVPENIVTGPAGPEPVSLDTLRVPCGPPRNVSVSVTTPYGAAPRIAMIVPTVDFTAPDKQPRLTSFLFEIQRGGKVKVLSLAVNENVQFEGKDELKSTLEHVIHVTEDIGTTAEWIREQVQ